MRLPLIRMTLSIFCIYFSTVIFSATVCCISVFLSSISLCMLIISQWPQVFQEGNLEQEHYCTKVYSIYTTNACRTQKVHGRDFSVVHKIYIHVRKKYWHYVWCIPRLHLLPHTFCKQARLNCTNWCLDGTMDWKVCLYPFHIF